MRNLISDNANHLGAINALLDAKKHLLLQNHL